MRQDNITKSYAKHSDHEKYIAVLGEKPSQYTRPGSVDAWRHTRMLDTLASLIKAMPDSTWLTVGDGKYGTDAHFLENQGLTVTGSSLNDATLKIAHELGYIKQYKKLNAESLSLDSNSVDFVLCKESYHHFPRPPIALYEMLRVSKIGIVLIEPIEGGWKLLDWFKQTIKKMAGRPVIQFEPSGNYLYRTNPWEIRKLLIAAGLPGMGLKRMNDLYLPRFAKQNNKKTIGSAVTKFGIFVQDLFCRLGLMNWGLGVFVIFKLPPDEKIVQGLSAEGFRFYITPENPYLDNLTE